MENELDHIDERKSEPVERGVIGRSLHDSFVYLTTSPKARPYIKSQNAIEAELEKDGLSEEFRIYLIEKDVQVAEKISDNTPQDAHPYRRIFCEVLIVCAIGGGVAVFVRHFR